MGLYVTIGEYVEQVEAVRNLQKEFFELSKTPKPKRDTAFWAKRKEKLEQSKEAEEHLAKMHAQMCEFLCKRSPAEYTTSVNFGCIIIGEIDV